MPEEGQRCITMEQVRHEVQLLRDIVGTRLDAMDKAVALLQSHVDKSPTTGELNVMFNERQRSIQVQLDERDRRFELAAKENQQALDAAFASQKEAVAKSEGNTTKQIDQLVLALNTANSTLDEKINDTKTRISNIEARGEGYSRGFGYIATGIGIVSAIIGAIVALFFKVSGA